MEQSWDTHGLDRGTSVIAAWILVATVVSVEVRTKDGRIPLHNRFILFKCGFLIVWGARGSSLGEGIELRQQLHRLFVPHMLCRVIEPSLKVRRAHHEGLCLVAVERVSG